MKAGRVKSIGLSNVNETQIERIVKIAEILPANNQVHIVPIIYLNLIAEIGHLTFIITTNCV